MNDVMSFGLHRNWKKEFVGLIEISDDNDTKILDLAGGTGDIAKRILKSHPNTSIEIIDKNFMMLKESSTKDKILKSNKINLICGDGENIPLNDNSIDVITLSFGIRNMTDRIKCLKECYRVLKPGGQFLCMEFSMPESYTLRNMYDVWSFFVIPKLGKLIAKSEESYKYLVESIRTFPKPDEFVEILEEINFKRTSIRQLSGNIVCIYKSRKI
jgi:ubiquinone/menaquinone biosynthesis methyltransferase